MGHSCLNGIHGSRKFCSVAHVGSIVMRTANVEQVKAVLFRGVQMVSEDHEYAHGARIWRAGVILKWKLSILSQCWSHESVIKINMKALTLFPLVQQLPLSITY